MGTTKGYALLPDEARDLKDMLRDWRNQKQSNGGITGNANAADQRQFNMKVRLTSAISGQGGRYNGKLITNGVSTSGTSGNLAAADLGALAASVNVIVWNLSEAGLSTHDVNLSDDSQCVQLGMLLSYDRDSGKAIIGVVVPITRLTVTDCGDHEGTGRRAILGPGFTLTTTTSSGYVGTIDTNFKNNDNYLDIYVDDCAVAFDWLGFDSQWYICGNSSLETPYLTTDTPDSRGTTRLVFDTDRSGSTCNDNQVHWVVDWSSGTLTVKGSVTPKLHIWHDECYEGAASEHDDGLNSTIKFKIDTCTAPACPGAFRSVKWSTSAISTGVVGVYGGVDAELPSSSGLPNSKIYTIQLAKDGDGNCTLTWEEAGDCP